MGDNDRKTTLFKLRLDQSASVDRDSPEDDVEETSSVRERSPAINEAITVAVRAALELACAAGDRIGIRVRGEPARALPVRTIEGVVVEINVGRDGRERVVIDVADGCSQIVLVERVVRVVSVK